MAAAIRERLILSVTYADAMQPQLFAPLALYVTPKNEMGIDGYEMTQNSVRWREVKLSAVRDVQQTERAYDFSEDATAVRKTYAKGTTVLAGTPNPPRGAKN